MSGQTQETNADKLYGILSSRSAPAHVGKPVLEKHMEIAKACGARSIADIIGHRDLGDKEMYRRSLNFGSRKDVSFMPDETRLALMDLKKIFNLCEIQAQIATRNIKPGAAEIMATPAFKTFFEPMAKAFNITDFSSWIPTVNARFYFEEFEIPLLISDLFDQMPMDSATVTVPGALDLLFGRLETDIATFGVQSNSQASFSVNAKNNVCHTQITEDLMQDSAPAIIEKLRREVVKGVARSEDRTLIQGDDSLTHMYSDVTAATDFRKAYKGLSKLALANSANGSVYDHNGDSANKNLFANMLQKIGAMAEDKADLAYIMGVTLGNQLVTGAIPELFTAFAFGSPASNVTGQVPPVFGVKPVQSQYMREDLDATGVYSGAAQTKTTLILVKKSRFMNFLRQPIRVWAAPSLPSSDLMLMTAKKRGAFAGNPQSATEKSVIIGINIETAVV